MVQDVMYLPPPFDDYPASFPAHSRDPSRLYTHRSGCFAAPMSAASIRTTRVLYSLQAEGLVVCAGTPPVDVTPIRPVYALGETEPPAVPTGRIFVQAAPGRTVAGLLEGLDFAVESVPPYAPHAAWVVARDGRIGTALARVRSLIESGGIESVEPQMLRPSVPRP